MNIKHPFQPEGYDNWKAVPEHLLAGICGTDAAKWAAAFVEIAPGAGSLGDDAEGLMIGWFANAIEQMRPPHEDNFPGVEQEHRLLEYFSYDHLPPGRRQVSEMFHDLARNIVNEAGSGTDMAELTAGLRKLLECKDCIVRCGIHKTIASDHLVNITINQYPHYVPEPYLTDGLQRGHLLETIRRHHGRPKEQWPSENSTIRYRFPQANGGFGHWYTYPTDRKHVVKVTGGEEFVVVKPK